MSDDEDDPEDDPSLFERLEPVLKKARYAVWQRMGESSSSADQRPCCSRDLPDVAPSISLISSSSSRSRSRSSSRSRSRSSSSSSRSSSPLDNRPCRVAIAWRAEQEARALASAEFDNTINTMIENLRFPLLEFGNIMDGYSSARRDSSLEDQAVQMAIQSHGLQKPCTCPRPMFSEDPRFNPAFSFHASAAVPFHHRTGSSIFFEPSTSSEPLRQAEPIEQVILSEALNVAILNKGLGASPGGI